MKSKFEYVPRICECCGSNSLEELWSYGYCAPTRKGIYEFSVRNVICRTCGFVFVSPVPSANSLRPYYADSFTYWDGQALDYDIEKRITFIKRHLRGTDFFLEIGSNTPGPFHRELADIFSRVVTSEINQSVESDYRSLDELPANKIDMIAHYFVLEHITEVRSLLRKCHGSLKDGGIMICEVPDLSLYQKDVSGLILFEHMNHFSIQTLYGIASAMGFELLESSVESCSRSFGFTAAFSKKAAAGGKAINSVYPESKAAFLQGLARVEEMKKNLQGYYDRLQEYLVKKNKVILWAANDVLMRFLNRSVPPENTTVIDSNPLRKNYSDKFPIHLPEEAQRAILESDAIFIFSDLNSNAILESIRNKFGKTYGPNDIIVVKN